MKKFLNFLKNIGVGFLILLVVLSIVSKLKKSDYILNFAPMKVLTGSMEPKIKVGDMIVAKKVDGSIIKEGDIITYKMGSKTYVTHRVVEVFKNGDNISFRTKGDANNIEDSDLVQQENLVGRLVFRIPKFGYLIDFITRPIGFLLLFILPTIVFLGKEIISLEI